MAKKKLVKINKMANTKPIKKNKLGIALSVAAAGVAVVGTATVIKKKKNAMQFDEDMLSEDDFMELFDCDCDDSCDDNCECDCHTETSCDCDDSCDDDCECDCHTETSCDCETPCGDDCSCGHHDDK